MSEEEILLSTFRDNHRLSVYSLVWIDLHCKKTDYDLIQQTLEVFIDDFQIFNQCTPCEKYIQSTSTDTQIIVIIHEHFLDEFLPRLDQYRQISDVYIHCLDISTKLINLLKKPINGISHQLNDLLHAIKNTRFNRRRNPIDEDLPINIFDPEKTNEKSAMEINGEFLQNQLLIDCLNQIQSTHTDKDKLSILCKKIYDGNPNQQKIIDEFQKVYSPCQAIRWYTRDAFLYRVLNKALRIQHTDVLFLFHFLIRDIEKQLRDHQYPSEVILYRGQWISKEELKLFEQSTNKLISITSFFSTSLNSSIADMFTDSNTHSEQLQSVFFEISASPSKNQSKPFAEVTSLSYFPTEKEVLMMLGSVFRIDGVDDYNERIKRIRMTLMNHDDQTFNSLFDFMRKKNCTGLARPANFGRTLIGMGKFNAAENHFKCLLKTFPWDHPDVFNCYQGLGKIFCEKCQFEQSLQCYQTALNILYRNVIFNEIRIGFVYNNIGEVYQKKGETIEAMKSYQLALNIFQNKLGEKCENVAWCLNNIGIVYLMEKNFSQALNYLEQAFNLKKDLLPKKHPCLGNTYLNLANVYCHLHDYDLALKYHQESHDIFQTSLCQKHPSIARALRNIGVVYELKGDLLNASIYYEKALNLRQQILSSIHPELIENQQDLQRISSKR